MKALELVRVRDDARQHVWDGRSVYVRCERLPDAGRLVVQGMVEVGKGGVTCLGCIVAYARGLAR